MKKFRKSKCPTLVGFQKNGQACLIYCGQWSCDYCAKRLAKKWAIRVYMHIEAQPEELPVQWQFLTLTLGSGYKNAELAYSQLKKLWNRLRMAVTRSSGKWQYVAFVEGQPKRANMPHFHVIMSVEPPVQKNKKGQITKHALHNWGNSMGWGFQIDLKIVNSRKAAYYTAKYTAKGAGIVPRGFRRVRTSQGWYKKPVDPSKKLIVPAKTEDIGHFIARVSDETGLAPEEAYKRWSEAQAELIAKQNKSVDTHRD
jgi:hypothetical protein